MIKLLPVTLLVIYLIGDTLRTNYYRRKIKWIIHVNGTRGKSSVVKMIDEVMRADGRQSFVKITGVIPSYRDCSGKWYEINRVMATVLEQKKILRQAAKNGAEVLVIECMALAPNIQAYSEAILKANICVITNLRTDHLEVMGVTKEERAKSLFAATRKGQQVIVGDAFLYEQFKRKEDVHLAKSYEGPKGLYHDNCSIVHEVCQLLEIEDHIINQGFQNYSTVLSKEKVYRYKGHLVHFGFAINDLESTLDYWRCYAQEHPILWLNDRVDRPMRSQVFLEWIVKINPVNVVFTGDRIRKNSKKLRSLGYKGKISTLEEIPDNQQSFVGIGNIKGLEIYFGEIHV